MLDPKIKEKQWSKDFENEIYESWKRNKDYKFVKNDKKVYSIDTPPPYVNTSIHIGQATTYVLMDMFARYRRMKGFNVLFPLGLDRNGLPIEVAAEKKFKIKLTEVPRETFIEYCKKVLEETSNESVDSYLRLGISFNSFEVGNKIGDVYYTDSDDYRQLTQETFIDLWNKGLIYEDERANNYCPGCQTTIADAEIEYEELKSFFNDIKFKVKETGEDIIIGTTRPELIPSCGMIIYNPSDKRYKHLKGKHAITPIFNKEVPIMEHSFAQQDKGTGLMMMCSFGDVTDIRFFREMKLKPIISINKDGTMNENAGFLKGMNIKDAQKALALKIKEEGLLAKQERIVHRTPICERSKDPIEFIFMKEYYVKQLDYKEKMMEIAKKINFYHENSRQILIDWINSVSIDWPITRRRYYATEVPLWYCKKCNEIIVPEKGRYYKPWKENPPIKKCKCGSTEFRGDQRVLDTWFDSSISPLYILKYSRDDEFFNKNFPCSLRSQGKEIIRTWLYYTLLKDYLLTGKIAFKDVWINYHVTDEKGKKMSKSLGNIIDPKDVLNEYGAEPFRLWAAVEGNLDQSDFIFSFERIEGAGKTLTKLWNVARFVSMFEKGKKVKLTVLDEWIINELNKLIKEANEKYEKYDFHNPSANIKHFIWETFASHYIELVKNRAYNENEKFSKQDQESALFTLHYCLQVLLKLLAPINPMITEKIYIEIYDKDIHKEEFPEVEIEVKNEIETKDIVELDSLVWKTKKDNGKSLKEEIRLLVIPRKLESIEKDLISAHNVKEIKYGDLRVEL